MESDLIDWLKECLPPHPCLRVGIGDDGAVVRPRAASDSVVTVDMLADGTHFQVEQDDIRQVGYKVLAVNLSDLAAMAARPESVVVALMLPRKGGLTLAKKLFEGLLPLAEEFGVAVAGGDTNSWQGPLVVSVTATGLVTERGPLLRSGARAGDEILVTGTLGGSRLGRHLRFEPRVREALALHGQYELHAGIDISDGLALDLTRMARASACGAVVDVPSIPLAQAAREMALADGRPAWEHALADGEDFELLLAVPPAAARRMLAEQPVAAGLTRIGQFTSEREMWQVDADGKRRPLAPAGYIHQLET